MERPKQYTEKTTIYLHPDQLRELRRRGGKPAPGKGFAWMIRNALDAALYPEGLPKRVERERAARRSGWYGAE